MSDTRTYRKFTAQQKTEIVLASLRGPKSMAELCREHDIADSLLRKWREQFLAAGAERLQGRQERTEADELRRQIGRLERDLAGLLSEGFGRVEVGHRVAAVAAEPRVLDLGELERLRDELADRVSRARQTLREQDQSEARNRELLRQMLASPADFKWVQVSRDDLGLPGCGHWHSRPRLGPLGMLMGWWRVRVSSGCPLAGRLAAVEQGNQAAAPGQRARRPPARALGQLSAR